MQQERQPPWLPLLLHKGILRHTIPMLRRHCFEKPIAFSLLL